ncbi:MAG TPA: hypothetical protein VFC82_03005 [Actinomycetaceae bacterium]|nr:hypothetical protein [Actinomycetaceae bacterium]
MITRFTVVGERELPDHLLFDTVSALRHLGWLGLSERRRISHGMEVMDVRGHVPPVTFNHEGHDHEQMLRDLVSGWNALGVAAGVVRGVLVDAAPRLVIMGAGSGLADPDEIAAFSPSAGELVRGVRAAGGEVVEAGESGERTLQDLVAKFGRPVVAIGDDVDDLPLLTAADLGIAYLAQPAFREAVDAVIPFPRLDAALPLMGLWRSVLRP